MNGVESRRGRGILGVATALLVGAGTAGCDLDTILAVDVPGQVVEADLEDPAMAAALVRSAVSDLECSWAQYTGGVAHHGDEYMNASGNAWWRRWGRRQIESTDSRFAQATCDAVYALYSPLQSARFQAEDVYRRLNEFGPDEVDDLEGKLATVRAHGAYALVALGEGFCEMSIPDVEGEPGPLKSPDEVLRRAEERFTEALTLAEQSGNDEIRNLALVGRARVRLNLEEFPGVIADASQVDPGFLQVATRGSESTRRNNFNFTTVNDPREGINHATISDHFRDLRIDEDGWPTEGGDGVEDPRVNVFTEGHLAHNFVTEVWMQDKHTSRSTPMPIASYKEARLLKAEALVRTGELEEARTLINERRAELDLPTFHGDVGQSEMLDLVIEERRRDLFVEGGHRFNDMLRFRGTEHEIPFLGEPGSIHSDGTDVVGANYGDVTCLPLPDVERDGNPQIP